MFKGNSFTRYIPQPLQASEPKHIIRITLHQTHKWWHSAIIKSQIPWARLMVKVELWAAKIPGLPGIFADHYWLLVLRGVENSHNHMRDRWEIWQHPHQNSSCWGHLHKNLLGPYQGVGNGQSRLIQKWLNDDALLMVKRIESSPINYPFIQRYRYWPGPNSNTFAQWIVSDKMELGARAIGKSFPLPE